MAELFLRLWVVAAVIVVWAVVSALDLVNPLLLPDVGAVGQHFYELLVTAAIWLDLQHTAIRFLFGYGSAVLIGVPVGILLGSVGWAHNSMEFVLEFGRSTPVTAFFPLFLLLFGIGDLSKIAMVGIASIFIVILNAAYGVRYSSQLRRRVAEVYGATKAQIFFHITFWEALPQIVVGLRTALSLALIVVVVSEMVIGTEYGLGQRIFDAYAVSNSTELYALLVIIGTIGYGLNRLFLLGETWLIHWKGR